MNFIHWLDAWPQLNVSHTINFPFVYDVKINNNNNTITVLRILGNFYSTNITINMYYDL